MMLGRWLLSLVPAPAANGSDSKSNTIGTDFALRTAASRVASCNATITFALASIAWSIAALACRRRLAELEHELRSRKKGAMTKTGAFDAPPSEIELKPGDALLLTRLLESEGPDALARAPPHDGERSREQRERTLLLARDRR